MTWAAPPQSTGPRPRVPCPSSQCRPEAGAPSVGGLLPQRPGTKANLPAPAQWHLESDQNERQPAHSTPTGTGSRRGQWAGSPEGRMAAAPDPAAHQAVGHGCRNVPLGICQWPAHASPRIRIHCSPTPRLCLTSVLGVGPGSVSFSQLPSARRGPRLRVGAGRAMSTRRPPGSAQVVRRAPPPPLAAGSPPLPRSQQAPEHGACSVVTGSPAPREGQCGSRRAQS